MNRNINILVSILMIVTCSGVYAQGTLQFNQVKLVSALETVPSGKVWKIEKAIPSSAQVLTSTAYYAVPSIPNSFQFNLNGSVVHITKALSPANSGYSGGSQSTTGIYSGIDESIFPFWIPAGSTLEAGTGVESLSVIEFNIIP